MAKAKNSSSRTVKTRQRANTAIGISNRVQSNWETKTSELKIVEPTRLETPPDSITSKQHPSTSLYCATIQKQTATYAYYGINSGTTFFPKAVSSYNNKRGEFMITSRQRYSEPFRIIREETHLQTAPCHRRLRKCLPSEILPGSCPITKQEAISNFPQ